MYDKAIPELKFPKPEEVAIAPNLERLISLEELETGKIVCEPVYFNNGVEGAVDTCYFREGVGNMLLKAVDLLPEKYGLKIYDAWRPYEVQRSLFSYYHCKLKKKHAGKLSEDEIGKLAREFVSYPSEDRMTPFVHSTGGAIDLTIITRSGEELNMGSRFDDFAEISNTAYYENVGCINGLSKTTIDEISSNRRLLYNVMVEAGFTNLPSEWWHYDYGDRFWGYYKNKSSIYEGIYKIDKY